MPKAKSTKKAASSVPVVQENSLETVDFGQFSGHGFQNQTSKDVMIPFLRIIQDKCAQIKKTGEKFIEGAEKGMLFDTVENKIVQKPFFIVPCITENCYVEWVPFKKGGGFRGKHDLESSMVEAAKSKAKSFNEILTDDGNELQETFYIYALVLEGPEATKATGAIVLAFAGTNIKAYRQINSRMRKVKGAPPLFGFRLSVDTVYNDDKECWNFHINPAINDSLVESANLPGSDFEGLLHQGLKFEKEVVGGIAKVAYETQQEDRPSKSDEENDEEF